MDYVKFSLQRYIDATIFGLLLDKGSYIQLEW